MEEVISLYTEDGEPDPARPYVCFDETSKQLVAETRQPLPPKPGKLARFDYEYERCGTANVFMLVAPRLGWRQVNVTARRTRVDFAHQMRLLVDDYFPQATTIRVVLDNLNTHNPASLYEAFARRSQAHPRPLGVRPYAQTWKLVEHGRDRTLAAQPPVPQAACT